MTRARPLCAALRAFAAACLALAAAAQAPTQDDWTDAVEKANTHARFAVRRAASLQVAKAGDAAVPALRAFEARAGRAALSMLVVDAIARSDVRGAAVDALLEDWARDVEFPWRAQALGGLATRRAGLRQLFENALADPSHLFRIEGARGVLACAFAVSEDSPHVALLERARALGLVGPLLQDEDPRVRVRIAAQLAHYGDDSGLEELSAALARADAEFLGDPWGQRDAEVAGVALTELEKLAADAAALGPGFVHDAQERTRRYAEARTRAATKEKPPQVSARGGLEIRSCRSGDLFLRWSEGGQLVLGIDGARTVALRDGAWPTLRADLPAAIGKGGVLGDVICDFVHVAELDSAVQLKAAPHRAPAPLVDWLKRLAQAAEESGEKGLARAILERLPQFAGVSEK